MKKENISLYFIDRCCIYLQQKYEIQWIYLFYLELWHGWITQSERERLLRLSFLLFLLLWWCFLSRDFERFLFSIIYSQFSLTFFPQASAAAFTAWAMASFFLLFALSATRFRRRSSSQFCCIFPSLHFLFRHSLAKCPGFPH